MGRERSTMPSIERHAMHLSGACPFSTQFSRALTESNSAVFGGKQSEVCKAKMTCSDHKMRQTTFRPRRLHSRLGKPSKSGRGRGDRKSTRLNSSHTVISYAVFCLKKKKSKKYFYVSSSIHVEHHPHSSYALIL